MVLRLAARIAAVPFVVVVVSQAHQVAWISSIGLRTVRQVFSTAWFGWSAPYAVMAWSLMLAGAAAVITAAIRTATPRAQAGTRALWVAAPMVVVPTALLIAATGLGTHLYSPKYATLSLPFVAILIALALTAVPWSRVRLVALVLVLLVSIPTAVAVRLPHAKQNTHWAEAAAFVDQHRAGHAEGIFFAGLSRHPSATAELIRIAYPSAFVAMIDVGIHSTGSSRGRLWDRNGSLNSTVTRTSTLRSVWLLGTQGDSSGTVGAALLDRGFSEAGTKAFGAVVVRRYAR